MPVASTQSRPRSQIPWRPIGWAIPVALLILPWAVNAPWTVGDFIFAGLVFAVVGAIVELAIGKSRSWAYRGAVAMALAAGVFHIWITGAVGIIGNESNPGNLLYLAVVVIAIFGSLLAVGRPVGMAWAMGVAAIAEVLVPPIAYFGVADPQDAVLRPEVFACGIVFTGMWLVSAALFHKAAGERASA